MSGFEVVAAWDAERTILIEKGWQVDNSIGYGITMKPDKVSDVPSVPEVRASPHHPASRTNRRIMVYLPHGKEAHRP